MLLTKEVEYRGKIIPVEQLSKNSSKKLLVKCPKCGQVREVFAKAYFRKETGLCHKCTLEERAKSISVGTVFGKWVVIGEGKQKEKVLCKCNCGIEREVAKHSLLSGNSTSCGCSLKSPKLHQRKYLKVGTKYGRLTVVDNAEAGYSFCSCECGNKTKVSNYNLKHGITKSCGCLSREVSSENLKKNRKRGKEHHNWKGGISSKYNLLRATKEFKDFLNFVRARDKYKCKKCGTSTEALHVHHIKPVKYYPDLMFDKNNGILLCGACHRRFHKLYGKRATEKELFKFLSTS